MPKAYMLRLAAIVTPFTACPSLAAAEDPRPLDRQPYPGLALRNNPEGTVVGRVLPGPFQPAGGEMIVRSDLLISANGHHVDAAGLEKLLESLDVGDALALVVRRGPKSDPSAAVPKGDPDGREMTFTARLAPRDRWTGTIGRALPRESASTPGPPKGEFEDLILAKVGELGLRAGGPQGGGLDALVPYLADVQARSQDSQPIPAIVDIFRRPLSADRVEAVIAEKARAVAAGAPDAIDPLIAIALGRPQVPAPVHAEPDGFRSSALSLVRAMRDSVSIDGEHAAEHIAVIRESPSIFDQFVFAASPSAELRRVEAELAPHSHDPPLQGLPPALAAAVKGDILFFRALSGGRFAVVGGPNHNEYDMRVVREVCDTGGDDTYRFLPAPEPAGDNNHIIIDCSGNDLYESPGDFCGPGVGLFGVSVIDDRAGNDTYRSTGQFSIAAGLFGIGVILDRAGDDRYENLGPGTGWSQGVGFYGAGLIIDLAGNDTYLAEVLSQGVGGPRGLGAIIDASGNDLYRADGPDFPSAYATPGVFLAMSQGFGYGVRGYASGGVGAIFDLAGDDRYEAGEFSQGCGYFFALGLIHDFGGNDTYHGNRYSQAAAAHQAVGLLIDESGDDSYWSMTAASQSGAWDQSITMLIDRAGNDTYRCDGLGQGAAAQQALAILIDLAGSDHYQAAGGAGASVQGCSGSNEYHYTADRLFSFSLLLDLGPGDDWFSTGRRGTLATGALNPQSPEGSNLYGGFVHENPRP